MKMQVRPPRFFDVGANLLDPMFNGIYRGKERHQPDLNLVFERSTESNVQKMIVTAGTKEESRAALNLARNQEPIFHKLILDETKELKKALFCTIGVHPTRCHDLAGGSEDELNAYMQELRDLCIDGKKDGTVVAVGECGLDYARLQFCPKDVQVKGFLAQLDLAEELNLPLFLHNRDTGNDLYELLREHKSKWEKVGGVVHSFDDSLELAMKFVDLGLYLGINGCSLKTAANLEVVKQLPLHSLLLETDCPWCDIRQSHAGYEHVKTKFPAKPEKKFEYGLSVKNRTEPNCIVHVAEVIAGVKGISVDKVSETCWMNTHKLFRLNE